MREHRLGSLSASDEFHTIHILIIPAHIVALLAAHLILVFRHRHTQYPGPGRTERNVVGIPLKARAVKSAGLCCLVTGALLALAAAAHINPVWLYGPYHPGQVSAGSQPDWYMGVADGLLRVMPGREITLWGHTLALDNLIPLTAGVGLFLALGVCPFIEAWVTDDDRDHRLLDPAPEPSIRGERPDHQADRAGVQGDRQRTQKLIRRPRTAGPAFRQRPRSLGRVRRSGIGRQAR
ncbi:hypothetical protein AQJ66_23930 [Streptomyces bungoensis]|uniref:Cytochrome b/b6 N-terminal region profile domain-containing protein n=1 Tax=Streptomyces bungoensis TaxID=285568 RepID=A0A117RBG6_9ACTN|nr:hypothetical protein AQJ66_23930 [Streptomyces bungoensis]